MPNADKLREALVAKAFSDYATKKDVGALFTAVLKGVAKATKDLEAKIDARLAQIRNGKDGRDGKDGKDGRSIKGDKGERGERGPVGFGLDGRDGKDGKDGSPDTGNQIIEKINRATDLIASEAVEGLEDFKKKMVEVRVERRGIFGRSLLQLYVDGSKKGAIQYLNLVAGNNVSLTYSTANGRNDIVISATGGSGSLSILTATGTVDDSNLVFTFASEPTLVVVNGTSYRDGHGVAISGTSATLDFPVGVGGDIYGLGT